MRIAIIASLEKASFTTLAMALQRAEMIAIHFDKQTNMVDLASADGYILLDSDHFSPTLLSTLKAQAAKGKPILGVGDGAAILVKTGLIPGLPDNRAVITLGKNPNTLKNQPLPLDVKIRLSEDYQYNAFTRYLTPQHTLSTVISTTEGHFIISPGLLVEIEAQGLNIFCYCNAKGEISAEPTVNPTGSINNIAAVANKAGNVMAMIPHPEKTGEGDAIFLSMRDYITSRFIAQVAPLHYWPR